MQNYKIPFELETPSYGGLNTAFQFSLIPPTQSPSLQNAFMDEIGDISKRPGSVPVTTTALGSAIIHLTRYPFTTPDQLLATAGTTLYSLIAGVLTSATMTNPLLSANIYDADFTGINAGVLVNIKIIADGGILKQYDGTVVKDIVPAADDTLPAPANVLTDINTLGVKYSWVHSNYVFVSPGDNQVFYSKQATQAGSDNQYDYFPETNYTILVRKGDYINGPGIPFDDVCFIPMRQGWNVVTGTNFNDFDFGEYLNTINGVIAPRTPRIITKAGGQQTIAYLSDDGVHEIFTTVLDSRGKQYATKNLMSNLINFEAYGFTTAEKTAAIAQYIVKFNMYLLEISRDTTNYVFGLDTRSSEWYVWVNLQINDMIENDGEAYFAGNDGHLKRFDKDLYTDWNETTKTTGTFVHWKRYGSAESGEFSGFPSMWDAFLVESKQWYVPATLDITFIFAQNTDVMLRVIKGEAFIEGVSEWGYAQYVNLNFTDLLNEPNEIIFEYSRLSKYVQVLMENNRDEPVKLFKQKWKGRSSGK